MSDRKGHPPTRAREVVIWPQRPLLGDGAGSSAHVAGVAE